MLRLPLLLYPCVNILSRHSHLSLVYVRGAFYGRYGQLFYTIRIYLGIQSVLHFQGTTSYTLAEFLTQETGILRTTTWGQAAHNIADNEKLKSFLACSAQTIMPLFLRSFGVNAELSQELETARIACVRAGSSPSDNI